MNSCVNSYKPQVSLQYSPIFAILANFDCFKTKRIEWYSIHFSSSAVQQKGYCMDTSEYCHSQNSYCTGKQYSCAKCLTRLINLPGYRY